MYRPIVLGGMSALSESMTDLNKKVCVCIDHYDFDREEFKNAEYKVFIQIEPPEINPIHLAIEAKDKFDLILGWYGPLLDCSDKAFMFEWGDCWVSSDNRKIYEKTKLVSIIASHKRQLEGHNLRHNVIRLLGDGPMDVLGSGYNPIETKQDGLGDYKYSIIIENVAHENYFTEKIIDCLMCGTVPIYWGSQNIDKFFNIKGFHIANDYNDIYLSLLKMSDEDYNSKMEYIKENFELAKLYADPYGTRVSNKISEYLDK